MPQLSTGDGFPDVVVTGIAMTTALATDADSTWKKLLDGQSGIRKLDDPFVERFDLPVRIGGHLLEYFDHGIRSAANIEQTLGIPFLGYVPRISSPTG